MPNIELIGFSQAEVDEDLMPLIRLIIEDMGLIAEAVFTYHGESRTIDYNGNSKPFVRISSTSPTEAGLIAERLQLRMRELDVEVIEIVEFLPGKKPPAV